MGKDQTEDAGEYVKELNRIGLQSNKLDSAGAKRAKWIMCRLKAMGYSNERIHRLTNARWSVNSIKAWTKNVRLDPAVAERNDDLLVQFTESGSSIQAITEYLDDKKALEDNGLSLQDAREFMLYLRQSREELASLIELLGDWKQRDLSIEDLLRAHSNLNELDQLGYTNSIFAELKKAAQDYDQQSLLKAVVSYKGLPVIEEQLRKTKEMVLADQKKVAISTDELKRLEEKKAGIATYMKKHQNLVAMGLTEELVGLVLAVVQRYGGLENLREFLNKCQSIKDLSEREQELGLKCREREARLEKLNADHSGMQTAIGMCITLLKDHKMDLQFITQLIGIARQYGEPLNVLRAVTAMGGLENLETRRLAASTEVNELEKRKTKLESEVAVATQQYGEMTGHIKSVENELNLARVIYAVTYFPRQDIEFALRYAIMTASASLKICIGMNKNPKIMVRTVFPNKYQHFAFAEFEAIDLLKMALWALSLIDKGDGSS